ncbi:MAG: TrmB family transcriptional regulator [Candidatus Diapherotrites archaeon]|nr:TrmB family transcriptional regulator [Candidatus Diapherotrites archaeon]
MVGQNTVELLEKLGLTEYEAKTLNTLFKLKEAEAPVISRTAQVPKTRVYDVLEKLIQRNLLIEIKGRPKIYRAIEAEKAIDLMILNKKDQLAILEKEAVELKDNLVLYTGKEEKGEKVMKVKDRQDFERILGQELLKADKSIQGLTEITDEHGIIHEALKRAKDRDVTVKLLNSFPSKKLQDIAEVKHLNHGLNAFIIDGKKVVLAISDFKKKKSDYHFTILNEHEAMANALTHYFDSHWETGKDY